MKFCCASNAATKNVKIARKKSTFSQIFFNKIVIFPKITDFLKKEHIFWDSKGSSRHFDYLLTGLGLIIKL